MVQTPTTISDQEAQAIIKLADFCLAFARVTRLIYHPDGQRLETDSDHTVMLNLIGCAFAAKYCPHLDIGLISQFALVHDLVETYASDSVSLRRSAEAQAAKEKREQQALTHIAETFGSHLPWIHHTIQAYNRLDTPEARYIKSLDKVMPTITHILNHGAILDKFKVSEHEYLQIYQQESAKFLASFAADQPEVMALRQAIHDLAMARCYPPTTN